MFLIATVNQSHDWPVPRESTRQIWVQLGCNKTSQGLLWAPKLAIGAVELVLPRHLAAERRSIERDQRYGNEGRGCGAQGY
jgi:hypothetical protein